MSSELLSLCVLILFAANRTLHCIELHHIIALHKPCSNCTTIYGYGIGVVSLDLAAYIFYSNFIHFDVWINLLAHKLSRVYRKYFTSQKVLERFYIVVVVVIVVSVFDIRLRLNFEELL